MKQREMADLIYAMLGEILADTDFRLRRSEEGFVRKIPQGNQCLGVPLWNYNPEYEFSLHVTIRLDAVEAIFNQFAGTLEKYSAQTTTTITNIEYFGGGKQRCRVKTADDVQALQQRLTSLVRNKILPFADQHQTVEALDHAVNGQWRSIDITQPPNGEMHAVILARLAKNPKYARIVRRNRRALGGWFFKAPPQFESLVKFLADYQPA